MGVTESGKGKPVKKEKPDEELTDKEVLKKLFPKEAVKLLQAQTGDKPKGKPK